MATPDATVRGGESGPIHELDARRAYYVVLNHIIKALGAGLRWPASTVAEFRGNWSQHTHCNVIESQRAKSMANDRHTLGID